MKTITFIYKGGEYPLSLLYETKQGFVLAVHIDYHSKEQIKFFSLIENELLSIVPGDTQLIEVTSKGLKILQQNYQIRNQQEQICMQKAKNNSGNEYYHFTQLL